jgi:tRNA nucleotidyltransferase (CCA-adding enzyme)
MNEREKRKVIMGKREADRVLFQFFSWINSRVQPKRSEIYNLIDPLPTEAKLFMMARTGQTATRRYISIYFTQLRDTKPLLKGSDVIRMGVKPGPSIRKVLEDLLKARLDKQVLTRQDELDFIARERRMEP